MKSTDPTQLSEKISKMICELEYLLQFSRDSKLDQSENILPVLGTQAADRIGAMFQTWNTEREGLLTAAQKVAAGNISDTARADFIARLEQFCENTRPLNNDYLTAALRNLHLKIAPMPAAVFQKEGHARDKTVDARRRAYS